MSRLLTLFSDVTVATPAEPTVPTLPVIVYANGYLDAPESSIYDVGFMWSTPYNADLVIDAYLSPDNDVFSSTMIGSNYPSIGVSWELQLFSGVIR